MRLKGFAVITAAVMALSSCSSSARDAVEITSESVASVQISSTEKPAYSRVIALANGSAEIIDSLGLKSILVGRDIASTDESLKSVPIVTSGHQVIPEEIIARNPDLVIIDASVGPAQALTTLRKAKIKVVSISEVWDVGAINSKVREIAGHLQVVASGDRLAREIDKTINQASLSIAGSPKVAFLYLRGGNSIYLLGGKGSGADSMLAAIGAVDVGAVASSKPFSALTGESLIEKKPEIILVMIKGLASVGGVAGLVELPGIAQTPAGKTARVIAVDDSLLLSFGPRTPNLLLNLAAAINQVQR